MKASRNRFKKLALAGVSSGLVAFGGQLPGIAQATNSTGTLQPNTLQPNVIQPATTPPATLVQPAVTQPAQPSGSQSGSTAPLPEARPVVRPTSGAGVPVLSSETGYVLGPGDRVRMDVFNIAEYSREYQVLADGTLNLPLIGSVPVQGKTLAQAMADVNARYARYLRRPVVTLDLVTARPLQIAVVGEVRRPGTYEIPITGQQRGEAGSVNVTQVVQMAGGITQAADVRNLQVRRPQSQDPDNDLVLTVSLWDLLQKGDLSQDIVLQDGDTIVIPTATTINAAETTAVSTASFSPETITVNVVGEVTRPGAIEVPPNTPLNQAILSAGGLNSRADDEDIELVRLNPNGTVERRSIDINLTQGVNEASNPALRPNDIIVVRRSGASEFADAVGVFLPPLGGLLNLFTGVGNLFR